MTLKILNTPEERDLILPWRNAPEVRRAMYARHVISPENHCSWFERMQADPHCRWYLHTDTEGAPDGVVYFTDIDVAQRTAFWGFYARPEAPAGTGTRILCEALDHAFDELGLYKINGEVLAGNTASLHLHKKCGFMVEGTFRAQHFDGEQRIDIIRLGLLAEEWLAHRATVRRRIEQLDALAAQQKTIPRPRKIVILSDADNWINAMIPDWLEEWSAQGHWVVWHHAPQDAVAIPQP